jgi:peptidoglycan/LPS O-acetylase OafA/YrhL
MRTARVWYPLLDVLRGPAALLVLFGHWRNLLFKDFHEVDNPGLIVKLLYLFTGAGHEAVMLFFVLSGCVIAHVIYGLHERGSWSWRGYLSARLTRLWIVLIPALLLTAVWDRIGMWLAAGERSIYEGDGFGNILNQPVAALSGPEVLFGNVFFLQRILVPTFGSNGPVWSISYEFVYYLAYPLLLGGLVLLRGRWLAGLVGVCRKVDQCRLCDLDVRGGGLLSLQEGAMAGTLGDSGISRRSDIIAGLHRGESYGS